jgi:hypothetical protein
MATLDLTKSDKLALYFGTEARSVQSITLTDTLSAVTTLSYSVHRYVDHAAGLRVEFLGTERGSLRAILRFASPSHPVGMIVCTVVASLLVEALTGGRGPTIQGQGGDVFIIQTDSGDQLMMSPEAFDVYRELRARQELRRQAARALRPSSRDPEVRTFGLASEDATKPPIHVPIHGGEMFSLPVAQIMDRIEPIYARHDNQSLILTRGFSTNVPSRWNVEWRGVKYSALVTDEHYLAALRRNPRVFLKGDSVVADISEAQSAHRHARSSEILIRKVRSVSVRLR